VSIQCANDLFAKLKWRILGLFYKEYTMSYKTLLIGLLGLSMIGGCEQTPVATTSASNSVAQAVTPPSVALDTVPASTQHNAVQATIDPPADVSGVDLSKWQGDVDFKKIKGAGKAYVFIRATLGKTYADLDYKRNIQKSRAAGLATGSYHFYMTDDKPLDQFANFSKHVSLQIGDLPPVVDIEKLNKNNLPNTAAKLKIFLNLMEKKYGVKPIIYSGEYFANKYLQGFSDYPLWLAEYNKDKIPQLPLDWKHWTFWQYSQNGTVAGVEGKIDLNRFNDSQQKFQALLIQ
jgi:lysozyme